ncbi:MAG: DNA polymerase III subunit gamma/tau [Bryobacteraceae bacterium]|jgi:DNA polymerase-3 subunit gamma/tau
MYQVIARKYRPQTFSELVNQEHVRTTLEHAIAQNRVAHGYIFSGQRGTGKTTVARILARCLNCIQGPTTAPCGACASCLEVSASNAPDVIEIDAASNRGINEMRELRENVRYRPARDRYKVFIVDEAHQITSEAFNALLKTLEEPPEWVVFVLCTTEAHKIPATIASRCQHFSFRSVDFDEILARLRWICEQEGIQADPETFSVLAQVGEGSVRDSLSALDQAIACCGTTLNAAEVRNLLGAFSLDSLAQITQTLTDRSSSRMLEIVDELVRNGHHLQHFVRELARYFRNLLVTKIAAANHRLVAASDQERERLSQIAASFSEQDLTRYLQLTLDLFRDLQFSWQPRLHLELGLVRLVEAGKLVPIEEALASLASGTPVTPTPRPAGGGLQQRLVGALHELGMAFTADAVEHSRLVESGAELQFTTPQQFMLGMRVSDLEKAVKHLNAGKWKIKVVPGGEAAATQPQATNDDATRRALAHPEVQRFREVFPGAEVRVVRKTGAHKTGDSHPVSGFSTDPGEVP